LPARAGFRPRLCGSNTALEQETLFGYQQILIKTTSPLESIRTSKYRQISLSKSRYGNLFKISDIEGGIQLQDLGNKRLKIHHSIQHVSHASAPG
jgi:hypothetical protein